MTRHEKERIIREFWSANRGSLNNATEGARRIHEVHGIPVNTVRGIQNQLYSEGERPWNVAEPVPEAECPRCLIRVVGDAEVASKFGWRTVRRKKGSARKPQSYCRKCRVAKRRETRAKKKG